MPNFHICKGINNRAYDLQDLTGSVKCAAVADIQLIMPAEYSQHVTRHKSIWIDMQVYK